LNLALIPGEVDTILNSAFKSNPLSILSSNCTLVLDTTLLPTLLLPKV
jgi:hypothetical protein